MFATLKRLPLVAGTAGLSFALLAGGCATEELEADEIAAALEQENGGLDTLDEDTMFGEEDVFERAVDPSLEYRDALEGDPEVVAMMGDARAARYRTALQWGQMPFDPDTPAARDWSGTLRVNRGAILIRRVIRFEDATDGIAERTSPREVAFRSVTRPHNDGLRLLIVDPDPAAGEPLVLEYDSAAGVHRVALADLVAGPQTIVVDDLGNRMAGVAFRAPADPCAHGFLNGRWHQVRRVAGRLAGAVTDADGEVIGHVRGLYGVRRDGSKVFFGKYIDLEGTFQGIFGGRYGEGHFAGRWVIRGRDAGVLGGEYRESLPGDEVGGRFMGRWAETRCDIPLDR